MQLSPFLIELLLYPTAPRSLTNLKIAGACDKVVYLYH